MIYIMPHKYTPMKRLTLLVIASALLMTSCACAAYGPYHTDAPALVANLSQQIPYPAQPGEEVTLVVKTTNVGDEPAKNIVWYLDVKEPFELKDVDGETLPELRSGETANTEYYVEITIRVMGHPDIVLLDADVPKADPKSEFDAKFTIKNVGTGPAKNVKVYFENQTSILPRMSICYIDTIEPGEIAVIESSFFVDVTTPSQYPLGITIRYEDEVHEAQPVQSYSVLAPVSSGNTLFVYLDSQDELTPGTVGDITIGVANRGLAEVKHIIITIVEDDQFKVIGSSTGYIGDVESDDYDTADFTILPQSGCRNVTIKVDYADDYGNQYSRTTDIPIKVYSSQEMKEIAPGGGGYTWMIIGALILLLAFVFRKRIKRIISR